MASSLRGGIVESPAGNVNGSSAVGPILCHPSRRRPRGRPTAMPRKEPIMPRLSPVTGKSDVPADQHAVVDAVVKVLRGSARPVQHAAAQPEAGGAGARPRHVLSRRGRDRAESQIGRHPGRGARARSRLRVVGAGRRRAPQRRERRDHRSAPGQGRRGQAAPGRARDRDLRPSAHADESRRPGRLRRAQEAPQRPVARRAHGGRELLRALVRGRQRFRGRAARRRRQTAGFSTGGPEMPPPDPQRSARRAETRGASRFPAR